MKVSYSNVFTVIVPCGQIRYAHRLERMHKQESTAWKYGMEASRNLSWQSNSKTNIAIWQSEAGYPPPKMLIMVNDTMTADAAYRQACEETAMLYTGDFQNAKQLLQAVTRRADRKPAKPVGTMLEAFHQHRVRQIGRANFTNKILIELQHGKCNLTRSPE